MEDAMRRELLRSVSIIAVPVTILAVTATSHLAGDDRADAAALESSALPGGSPPVPVAGIRAVTDALQNHAVVALGESHNLAEAGSFYAGLVRSDHLASAIDAVVVEFGNARYQRRIDRYVSGGHVSRAALRRIWQDTTQVGAWDAPMYRRFFAAVRAGNVGRPPSRQIRVLLGDPPIRWSKVTSRQEVRRFLLRRERFMAHLIEREILAPGGHALLIAGLAHVQRSPEPAPNPNVTQMLDARAPGAVWVVGIHLGFPSAEWEEAISDWPVPSVASLAGTWIGLLPRGTGLAQDALDAMLYVGAPDALHLSIPLPTVYRDDAYWRELKRRWPLGVGGRFSGKAVFAAYADPGYPGLFSRRAIEALRAFALCMHEHAVESFPDPQFQYDAVGFYGAAIEEAQADPDFPAAFRACGQLLNGSEP
jgi:hypothetical protein